MFSNELIKNNDQKLRQEKKNHETSVVMNNNMFSVCLPHILICIHDFGFECRVRISALTTANIMKIKNFVGFFLSNITYTPEKRILKMVDI